jgi:hypothetical protein
MVFLNNIPQPTTTLSNSQPQLLGNMQQLDASFAVDHYAFSNTTGNNGFHNKVTTPAYVESPPSGVPPVTTAATPIFYAFQSSANLGTIQFSRGWQAGDAAPAAPTPVTCLQSSNTAISLSANTPVTVFNFTGLPRAIASFYLVGVNSASNPGQLEVLINWDGTTVHFTQIAAFGGVNVNVSGGNTLQINSGANTASGIYWTLRLHRIS